MTDADLDALLAAHCDGDRMQAQTHSDVCHLWPRHAGCAVAALVAEVRRLRAKNADLNRRAQAAAAAASDAGRCIDKLAAGSPWCGGSLGRAFLAWDNARLRAELKSLKEGTPDE